MGGADAGPLRRLEHQLHPWVAHAILPIFAFANAGVSFAGMSLASVWEPIPLGMAGGLFFGKVAGVFRHCRVVDRGRCGAHAGGRHVAQAPRVSTCAGIGFTMSLFIGTLAFEDPAFTVPLRLGVLTGSLLAASVGYLILACPRLTSDTVWEATYP